VLKEIEIQDWQIGIALAFFLLTSGVFIFVVIRTLRMKKEKIEKLSRLPLEKKDSTQQQDHE